MPIISAPDDKGHISLDTPILSNVAKLDDDDQNDISNSISVIKKHYTPEFLAKCEDIELH